MNLLQKSVFYLARAVGLTDPRLYEFMGGPASEAGENVNGPSVLGLATAWSCVNLIAGTHGSLPVVVTKTVNGGVDEEEFDHPLYRLLGESPNSDQTPLDFIEFCAASVELHGNAYSEISRTDGGRITSLLPPIPPELMTVRRRPNGGLEYDWTVDGRRSVVGQERMLHIRGFGGDPLGGLSTLSYGRQTFGLAQAAERAAARLYRHGVLSSGVMMTDKSLNKEQRKDAEELLQQKYQGAMNAGRPMLLDNGVKWQSLSINPDDAQMLESRSFGVEEICRFFNVPPHMIGHMTNQTSWGTGLEQQTLGFLVFTMRRRLKRFEQAMAKQLLTPADRARGLKIKFDLRGLMRGDSKARSEFYQTALQNGWMTINEVRELEGLKPIPGGDVPRMQMQNVPITEAGGQLLPPPGEPQ